MHVKHSIRHPEFPAIRHQLAPMKAARARLPGNRRLHALEPAAGKFAPLRISSRTWRIARHPFPLAAASTGLPGVPEHGAQSRHSVPRSAACSAGMAEAPRATLTEHLHQCLLQGPLPLAARLAAPPLVADGRRHRGGSSRSPRLPRPACPASGRHHHSNCPNTGPIPASLTGRPSNFNLVKSR